MNPKEYRLSPGLQIRTEQGPGMIVKGYATTFENQYVLIDDGKVRIIEEVARGAFDNCNMDDCVFLHNHNENPVFAKISDKTLKVNQDQKGLLSVAKLSETNAGKWLFDEIRNRRITKMSFGFTVAKDEKRTIYDEKTQKVTLYRRIISIKKLFDVSAVDRPANPYTNIYADCIADKRSIDRLKKQIEITSTRFGWRY